MVLYLARDCLVKLMGWANHSQDDSIPLRTRVQHLYKQQQEMERFGKAARATRYTLLLVASNRNILSPYNETPSHQWKSSDEGLGTYRQQGFHINIRRGNIELHREDYHPAHCHIFPSPHLFGSNRIEQIPNNEFSKALYILKGKDSHGRLGI